MERLLLLLRNLRCLVGAARKLELTCTAVRWVLEGWVLESK